MDLMGKGGRGLAVKVSLVATGVVAGAVLATGAAASASSGAASAPTPAPPAAGPVRPGPFGAPFGPGRPAMLSGTVVSTVTGSPASVTIRSAGGTVTYLVGARSDIDKNGESTVASLVAGEPVHFLAVTVNGKPTIAVLHAGNDALDGPRGMPGPCPGMAPRGTAPGGTASSGTASSGTGSSVPSTSGNLGA